MQLLDGGAVGRNGAPVGNGVKGCQGDITSRRCLARAPLSGKGVLARAISGFAGSEPQLSASNSLRRIANGPSATGAGC